VVVVGRKKMWKSLVFAVFAYFFLLSFMVQIRGNPVKVRGKKKWRKDFIKDIGGILFYFCGMYGSFGGEKWVVFHRKRLLFHNQTVENVKNFFIICSC